MARILEWKTLSINAGDSGLSAAINEDLDAGWDIHTVTLNSAANAYIILLSRAIVG